MRSLIARFIKDEKGVTAIEYGLIAAGVGLVLVAVAPALGDAISAVFTEITTTME